MQWGTNFTFISLKIWLPHIYVLSKAEPITKDQRMLLEANFERDQKRSDLAFVLSPDSSENLRSIFYI